jgi:hypothetical protein
MAREHWFDSLNKLLIQDTARREVLSTIAALTVGTRLGATDAAAGKNGGKDKKKDKNKDKKKKDKKKDKKKKGNGDAARCGQGICNQEFIGDQVVACEKKCGRCNVDGQFCVIEGDPNDPTKVATCCHRDEQCCQDTFACCARTATCCGGYPEVYPQPCCPEGTSCCASAETGCCAAGETCCPGVGCKDLSYDRNNCNACGIPCPDGLFCNEGACRCYVNAGTCVPQPPDCDDANCPRGQRCNVSRNDGLCGCGDGFKYCTTSQRCIAQAYECCGGPSSPAGYCIPPFPCCGVGVDGYCSSYLTCP